MAQNSLPSYISAKIQGISTLRRRPKSGQLFVAGLAVFLQIALFTLPGAQLAGLAQAERAYRIPGNTVTSITEGNDHHSLIIRLENNNVAPRPNFKYLAGSAGETVLVADFIGLAWNEPTKIIRLISSEKGLSWANGAGAMNGIKEVRVGQFVDSPAVLRISFVSKDPKVLKKVAIGAAPGLLKVNWGGELASSAQANPVQTNKNKSTVASSDDSDAGQKDPAAAADAVDGGLKSDAKGENNLAFRTINPIARAPRRDSTGGASGGADSIRSAIANQNSDQSDAVSLPTPQTPLQEEPAPTISLVPCDGLGSGAKIEILRIELAPGKEISFKGFRMHDPERYVIDIPNCRGIADATLPDLNTSSLISSLRVGVPNQTEGVGRLVLQLADAGVNVAGSYSPGSNYLSVTIGKGLMIGAETGPVEKFSGADIAPGPIVVPRAPSETVIVLDAGHGGTDPGAMRSDIQEKDITLGIILKLKKILEAKGARIVLTRHDDTFVSLEDRAKITNQVGPNLFLSVHINSLESTSNIYGIETYFQTDLSRPLAERVHASLVAGLAAPDRNIRRARFYVINHTPVPAILAEVGYITNKAERDRLVSAEYQQKVASALARGVMLYLQDNGVGGGQLANKAHLN